MAIADLSPRELWLTYAAHGGRQEVQSLCSYLAGEISWSPSDHDRAADGLNSYLDRRGLGRPVAYSFDY